MIIRLRSLVLVVILGGVVGVGAFLVGSERNSSVKASSPVCKNSDTIQCVNPQFAEQEAEFDVLVAKDVKMQQNPSTSVHELQTLEDQINGMYMRLHKAYPPGFDWDDTNKWFVKVSTPTPSPSPAQPSKTPSQVTKK